MWLLGRALLGVSVLNALFAFAQEMRAERAMEELRRFLPQSVRVRRDDVEREVIADDLVPGDVLLLAEGDRIAADARLVEMEDLLVNNAPLTGESRSQALKSGAAKGRLTDSPNIAFAGCGVLRGSGMAVVFGTSHRTELGKIAALSPDVRRPLSPLQRETHRMVRVLSLIALVLGLIFFAFGVASGRPLWVNIVFMLGIIVANVPEGLLPTFTLALSMASLRMAKKQVLVKTLDAVESLGAVHVICTDKTGTLTRNQIAISTLVVPLALTVIQILSIDLGTDLLPAIGLGQEPPERDGMQRPPRPIAKPLLSAPLMVTAYLFLGLIQAAFSLFLFFLVLHQGGWQWGQELAEDDPLYRSATGITLAAIVLTQVGNVIGRRSLRGSGLDRGLLANRLLLLGIATEILFSWAILYVPSVQSFLQTGPVDWEIYALAWLGIPLLFGMDLVRKRLAARAGAAGPVK